LDWAWIGVRVRDRVGIRVRVGVRARIGLRVRALGWCQGWSEPPTMETQAARGLQLFQ